MKTSMLFIGLIALHLGVFAQTIKGSTVAVKDSKEAKKAISKGNFYQGGYYWNTDKTLLYKLTVFTAKKSNEEMLQIHAISELGEVVFSKVEPFTDEVLKGYDIHPANFEQEQAQLELKNYAPAYINNTALAGKPKIVFGSFTDRYHDSGLWIGFQFEKAEKVELDEKFWSFVSFPLNEATLEKNYHLLSPPSGLGKLISGFGYRQYLNAQGKAYVGGLMATAGQDEFLSGVYDLKSRSWVKKNKINIGMKILPGQNSYERLENGNTAIILAGKDQYKCLIVDALGQKVSLTDLGTEKSGGTSNKQLAPVLLQLPNNQVAVASSSYQTIGGKGIGLGFGLVQNNELKGSWNFSNADLEAVLKVPAKQKVKLNKLKYLQLESIRAMRDGSYAVVGYATQEKANSSGRAQLLIHIAANGTLKACYAMESLTPPKEERLSDKMPTTLIATKNGFYWIERSQIHGYEKGVYSFTDDFGNYERVTSFREDRTLTIGQITRVNLNQGSISNAVTPKGLIVGDEIGAASAAGTLVISTADGLMLIR